MCPKECEEPQQELMRRTRKALCVLCQAEQMHKNAGKEQIVPDWWSLLAPLSCPLPLRSSHTSVELAEGCAHSCSEMISLHSPLHGGPAVCYRPKTEAGLGSGAAVHRLCWLNFLGEVAMLSASRVPRYLYTEAPPGIFRFHFTLSLLEEFIIIPTLHTGKLRLREF